jgi:hypothetical protein
MSEQLRILEMIEKGQITATEGMELLEALNLTNDVEADTKGTPEVNSARPGYRYKFFKVRVTSDNSTVNVNVNVPLRLLTTLGEIATKMTSVIPADARREMESKGIDISNIDFAQIINEIVNGTLDDPSIVDVEVWSEEQHAMVKVKIYVE